MRIGLLLLRVVLNAIHGETGTGALRSFGEDTAIILFLNLGVLFYLIRMGLSIRKGAACGKKYTRIMLPSFIFILFADIFFIIASVFKGGIFRGWLAKKVPEES